MSAILASALAGYATSLSLILAIGAQNAFVLRQGLRGEHVFWICLFCAASDAVLIAAGVAGFGAITARWPGLPDLMRWGGAAFLVVYGLMRLRAAWRGGETMEVAGTAKPLRPALLTCAAMTWANPHVYLDTLGLIGAVSTAHEGRAKLAFALGAIAASFSFFFALGYGARLLRPYFQSPRIWAALDAGIGVVMLALAAMLLAG